MHEEDLERFGGPLLSAAVTAPHRRPAVMNDALVLGFDTEYRPADRTALSLQLAVLRKGEVVSRVYDAPSPRVSPTQVVALLASFLDEVGVRPRARRRRFRIYLVAHYGAAELGIFEDPLRDLSIRQVGKAHYAAFPLLRDEDGFTWQVKLVDLFGYFPASLKKIGKFVGLPKLDTDPEQLEQLMTHDRKQYDAYARRDAEIAVVAFDRLRSAMLDRWGLDILTMPTLPSLAASIFRHGL